MTVIFLVAFFGVLALLSALGWVADSREFPTSRLWRDDDIWPRPGP